MTQITADQLPSYTLEQAAEEFGLLAEKMSQPGIYTWLEERMGCYSDFEYLGELDVVPLPTVEDIVEEYGHWFDSVEQARAEVESVYGVEITHGVMYHHVLPESCSFRFIRIV